MTKYLMVTCEILKDEINEILKDKPVSYPIIYLPPDLHTFPEKLNQYLQDMLDRVENVDYILLPMGRCGNGTLGLKSKSASLVLPRCEDCVNLLLSDENLSVERPQCSMFFTAGWLRNATSANNEYSRTIEKYGKEKADMVMNMMYSGYKYFTVIDTGAYDKAAVINTLRPLAEVVDVEINEKPGRYGVLRKMLRLDFDNNFVIVPPGERVTAGMLELV